MMPNEPVDEATPDNRSDHEHITRWSDLETHCDRAAATSICGQRDHHGFGRRTSSVPSACELIPDGGRTTEADAIETSNEGIQQYAEGPFVSVVQDGDKHLIVRCSSDEGVEMKRVPATREAVVQNEKLWTIPSNWDPTVRIRGEPNDTLVYIIPESGVSVVLEMLNEEQVYDERFRVKRFGHFRITIADEPDRSNLGNAFERLQAEDDLPEDLLDALKSVGNNWQKFDHRYRSYMRKWGTKAAGSVVDGETLAVVDSWRINPWREDQEIGHIIWKAARIEDGLRGRVANLLIEEDVVSLCPDIQLTVEDRENLPVGYDVQSLIDAGCTPAEAVDYIMCVLRGQSPRSWARTRGVTEETVEENITTVEGLLND